MMRGLIAAGSSEHPASSSSSRSDKVPAIFLSHSGEQKPFVENLYEALRRVNHIAFFDQHTLPKGSHFPERIKNAARHCMLGVVVLSEDFLTSKWPMLELQILVQERGLDAKVLPLFYKIGPKDLNSPEKLADWRKKWEENARTPEDAVKWGQALSALRGFNGEKFVQGTSEALYIKRVVWSICKQVLSPLPYDLSQIKGHHRLAKFQEVAGQFDRVYSAQQDGKACMVGLHGVGGLGKSTMCKVMANFYCLEYPGKSHHLELPTSDGRDMGKIITQECKKALKGLANLDDELLLSRADDMDQVIQLMKAHLSQLDVFLAIDNVWESSLEAAARILKVGFSPNSKILVTSRSKEVLTEVLRGQKNSCVGPLPTPKHGEAFQTFQEAFQLADLNSLLKRSQFVDRALQRCMFHGTYHPIALKALGVHVKNGCALGDSQHLDDDLSRILKGIWNVELTSLEDVIRLSFDNLHEHKKHMFLDITVLPSIRNDYGRLTLERALQLLSPLYNGEITAIIYELSLDGLLQLETDGETGERIIRVHDLLSDLAQRAAATSPRFFIAGRRSSKLAGEIQWQELERVVLEGERNAFLKSQLIEKLQQQECRKLKVLDAHDVEFSEGIDMRLMPSLCVLKLRRVLLRSIQNWSASALVTIDLTTIYFKEPLGVGVHIPIIGHLIRASMRDLNLKDVAQLQMLLIDNLKIVTRIKGLDTLKDLHHLYVNDCPSLVNLDGLSGLRRLMSIRVEDCVSLKRMPDLSRLTCLQELILIKNGAMEEVGGLSPTLKTIVLQYCGALKRIPDLSSSTCLLDELGVSHHENEAMEEVLGGLGLQITCCGALKKLPNLSGLTRLDKLTLWVNKSMEEVGGLSPFLRVITIFECSALKKVPDISGLTRLEELTLHSNNTMEEVAGQSVSTTLRHLSIYDCVYLRRVPKQFESLCAPI